MILVRQVDYTIGLPRYFNLCGFKTHCARIEHQVCVCLYMLTYVSIRILYIYHTHFFKVLNNQIHLYLPVYLT